MDLTQLSDADLDALEKNDLKSVSDHGLDILEKQTKPQQAEPVSLGKQIYRSATDALPAAGGIVGGILGTPADMIAGPMGNIAGATAGYTAGTAAKNLLNTYFDPENAPKTPGEAVKSLAEAAPEGALQEAGGQLIGKGVGLAAKGIGKVAPEVAEYLAKKFGKVWANVPEKYTEEYLARQGNIEARPTEAIMDELQGHYNESQAGLENAKSGFDAAKEAAQETKTGLSQQLEDQKYAARDSINQASDELNQARSQVNETKSNLNNEFQDNRFQAGEDLRDAKQNLDQAYTTQREQLVNSNVQHLKEPIQDGINQLQEQVSDGSSKAFKILDREKGTIGINPLINTLNEQINSLKINGTPISDTAAASVKNLESLGNRLVGLGDNITYPQAKQILMQLDGDIKYSSAAGSFSPEADAAKAQIRHELDTILKDNSDAYKKQMQIVAEKTDLLAKLSKGFGTESSVINRLNEIASEKGRQVDLPLLQRLGNHTGQDFTAPIQQHIANVDMLNSPTQMQAMKEALPEFQPYQAALKNNTELRNPAARRSINELQSMQNANLNAAAKQQQVDTARKSYNEMLNPQVRRGIDEAPEMVRANDELAKRQAILDAAKERAQVMQPLNPNQIQSKVKSLTGANNYGAEHTFADIDKATGKEYGKEIKDRAILDSFGKTDTQGSRKTVVGGVIGHAIGGPIGSAVGAGIGFVGDKYAGQSFKAALDTGIGISKFAKELGPYAKTLTDAAARGPQALAAAHYILQQRNPDYQKRVNQITGNGQ
jgi:hypothetical protein